MSDHLPSSGTVAVIILTYNEEANIAQALSSVVGWADEVFVFDSMSTDSTLAIAKRYECHVAQHPFEDYGKQRNHALDTLPIRSEWVFFLDADESFSPDLKNEIARLITTVPAENGFFVSRRFMWMGRWIRRGYYPCWILRLLRHGKGRCEDRAINEHLIVEGTTGYLSSDLVHEDRRGVGQWITKHNAYATREAQELIRAGPDPGLQALDARLFGSQPERKRWIRQHIWNRLPPLVRPFVYFTYRYLIAGGFLDGKAGFVYHFFQALWFPLLIDAKYLEIRRDRTLQRERDREAATREITESLRLQR
jgi:glycosyltransferase involved in cell wall biosynthesis